MIFILKNYKYKFSIPVGLHLAVIGMVCGLMVLSPGPAEAVRGYTERDYIVDRHIRFQGYEPVLNDGYTISVSDKKWDQTIGYVMSKDRALLIEFTPVTPLAGVIMLASETGSPRKLKAVWADDHITTPIRIWTDRFWTPDNRDCDATGCPRIMFRATSGTLNFIVKERKN